MFALFVLHDSVAFHEVVSWPLGLLLPQFLRLLRFLRLLCLMFRLARFLWRNLGFGHFLDVLAKLLVQWRSRLLVRPNVEGLVEEHEAHVAYVHDEKDGCLPCFYDLVVREGSQNRQGHDVVGAIPEQRPPGQLNVPLCHVAAQANHEENIKHSRTHDGAETDVVLCYCCANHRGEELWSRAASCHPRCTSHVRCQFPRVAEEVD
mmetsp:Transcript_64172/g.150631  ORF Transcript_64172/g.150631 Transcript_64172/m.150631 type:complete len:205 (+) Transcript_64172:726-1340(+)